MRRVKTALLGDLSRYSEDRSQAWLSRQPLRDLDRQSNFGRGYASTYAAPSQAAPRRTRSGLSLIRLYRAVRSIGEYDLERTR